MKIRRLLKRYIVVLLTIAVLVSSEIPVAAQDIIITEPEAGEDLEASEEYFTEQVDSTQQPYGASGGSIIYTSFTSGNYNNTGQGTSSSPYNLASTAIEKAKDGDTIVIKNKGFVNEIEGNSSSPLIINKAITIKGEGDRPVLDLRTAGIIVGANVTFENLSISFANTDRNAIMANGYTVILDGVSCYINSQSGEVSTQAVNLFCGGIGGYSGTNTLPQSGNHGKLIIRNGYSLGDANAKANIYAGNIVDDLVASLAKNDRTFNGDATITVEGMHSSNYLGEVYAHGAVKSIPLGIDISVGKVAPPAPNTNLSVAGTVTVGLNFTAIKYVNGDQGNGKYANVTYNDTISSFQPVVDGVQLYKIGNLTASSGYMITADGGSFGTSEAAVSIASGARLGLNGFGDNPVINNFTGGGALVLGQNQHLSINGQVTGTTYIGIGSISNESLSYRSENAMTVGHKYITAAASNADSFKITPKSGDISVLIFDATKGTWTASNPSSQESGEVKIEGLTFYDGNNALPALGGTVRRKASNSVLDLTVIADTVPDDGFVYLYEIPFTINVTSDTGMVNATRHKDTDESYYYTLGTSLRLSFGGQDFYVSGYAGLDSNVPVGTYKIDITIPKAYSSTGYSYSRSFTLKVEDESSANPNAGITRKGDENYSNLVVFVDFKDTAHKHGELSGEAACYTTEDGAVRAFEQLFNGDANNLRTLKQYMERVSGGKIKLMNYFPQYDGAKMVPIKLNNDASYYAGTTNEPKLIKEVADKLDTVLKSDSRFASMDLDLKDKDGTIDHVTIVVPSDSDYTKANYIGHMTTYTGVAGTANIMSKRVGGYTIIPEVGSFTETAKGAGMITHEFLHSLGLPDLYRQRNESDGIPVGQWDIMATDSYKLQYPLAYFRAKQGWINNLQVVTSSGKYTLKAPTTADAVGGEQAVILKANNRDDEFFVVEYRKKSTGNNSYEAALYGSGLVIYRVNTTVDKLSNAKGGKDGIYVFRSGDTRSTNGESATSQTIASSFLSSDSGRTTYGSSESTDSTAQNAITYSDGKNSGIVIKNVGSSSGSYISFDVDFNSMSPSPTPSISPSPSPSVKPSPSPSVKPSPSPSASPSPSPSVKPSPSPSASPSPSPSPSGEESVWGDLLQEDIDRINNPNILPNSIPDGLWISGEDLDDITYTGKAITRPDMRVYMGNKLLVPGKDIKISYKNNTKAYVYKNGMDESKRPSIIITGIGNYHESQSFYFDIKPISIDGKGFEALDITALYNKKVQKPVPVLKYNGKALKNKTDYQVTYTEESTPFAYTNADDYIIELTGIGNYSGTIPITFTITDKKLFSKMSATMVKGVNLTYTGDPIEPTYILKDGKNIIPDDYYIVSYDKNTDAGTAMVKFTAKESSPYSGTKIVTFKITGKNISKATVTGKDAASGKLLDKEYTGDKIKPSYTLSFDGKTLIEGDVEGEKKDYTTNNIKAVKPGTYTYIITGHGNFEGTSKKISFKIKPYSMGDGKVTNKRITVDYKKDAVYSKAGAKPDRITVKDGEKELTEGVDYTVVYKNNTSVNDNSNPKKLTYFTIKGKGCYSGSTKSYNYTVSRKDFNAKSIKVTAADKVFQNKSGIYKTTISIVDGDKKLSSSDYDTKNIKYIYHATGAEVSPKDPPIPAGTRIDVEVTAKGNNYSGSNAEGFFYITNASISSLRQSQIIEKTYIPGKKITFGDSEDLKLEIKESGKYKKLLRGIDYEIVPDSYTANDKKGTAKVTVRGKGNYGGTKVISFKIVAKSVRWK